MTPNEKKCPFAADKHTNPQQLSHKELSFFKLLEFSKAEYQKGIIRLYHVIEPALTRDQSSDCVLAAGNQLLKDDILNEVDCLYNDDPEVTNQIMSGLGHAIRTITLIRDVYRDLGGSAVNTKRGIRGIVYKLTTIGLYDLPSSEIRLKMHNDLYTPIKQIPYNINNFFIDENELLQFNPSTIEDLLGKGSCPAIGAKSEKSQLPIIDEMLDKLVG